MKYGINFLRFVVGFIFILSGYVKLVDPYGTAFKLQEYFSSDVLNLPFLDAYTLPIALMLVLLEFMLGIFLCLGILKLFTLRVLLALTLFFAFLTFYSAYFDKVSDCGCFGDFMKLKPWQSFYKDLILMIIILAIYPFSSYIHPLFSKKISWIVASFAFVGSVSFAIIGIVYLPIHDWRAFAVNQNIITNMQTLRDPQVLITYTLKNTKTHESKEMSSDQYIEEEWWKDKTWELQSDLTKDSLIDEGIPARIPDFEIQDETFTQTLLAQKKLILITNFAPLNNTQQTQIDDFVKPLTDYTVVCLSATQRSSGCYPVDATILKTVCRANPAVLLVSKGIIKGKWSWRNLPSQEELAQKANTP